MHDSSNGSRATTAAAASMPPASSSSSTSPLPSAHAQLRALFPSIDPGYLDDVLASYPAESGEPAGKPDRLVARVTAKLLDANHGCYPVVLLRDIGATSGSSTGTGTGTNAARKGKGRQASTTTSAATSMLQVDVTASMNAALIQLNDMFPSVDLAYLRRALNSQPHSYIYGALAHLLADPTLAPPSSTHANSRSPSTRLKPRNKHDPLPRRINPGEMGSADLIKDAAYADSALKMLSAQFPNVWKSSIKAVMAEHNNDYFTSVEAVRRLEEERPLNFFTRTWAFLRQAFTGEGSTDSTAGLSGNVKEPFSIQHYLATTPDAANISRTLLYELHLHLAVSKPDTVSLTTGTRRRSSTLASKTESTAEMECGCCFADVKMGDMTSCADGCLFCMDCVARAVKETVYGQAPLQLHAIRSDKALESTAQDRVGGEGSGIRCLSIEGCQAPFSDPELRRTLPEALYARLHTRLAEENLRILQAQSAISAARKPVRLVRCPFCPYTAVEAIPSLRMLWSRPAGLVEAALAAVSLVALGGLFVAWSLTAIMVPELFSVSSKHTSSTVEGQQGVLYFALQPVESLKEIARRMTSILDVASTKRNGTVFRCPSSSSTSSDTTPRFASPALVYSLLPPSSATSKTSATQSITSCGRASCRLCNKLHYAGHECADSLEGLRLAMESAASNAVKRQCPECGLSFLKDNGCNKVVCRCGYAMCFVCRKGIGAERYAHFCQHPRDTPGSPCSQCNKCDLFKVEDETRVKRAVQKAKLDWLAGHPESAKEGQTQPSAHAGQSPQFSPMAYDLADC